MAAKMVMAESEAVHRNGAKSRHQNSENTSLFHTDVLSVSSATQDVLNQEESQETQPRLSVTCAWCLHIVFVSDGHSAVRLEFTYLHRNLLFIGACLSIYKC